MKLSKILFLFLSTLSLAIFADENQNAFDSANVAYAKGNYDKAIQLYQQINSNEKVSAEIFYNLGNAYFKIGKLGFAILNYEKAKKILPEDEDILSNLKFANQKTEDKIDTAPPLFLTEWKTNIIELMAEKSWAQFCIFLLISALLAFSFYILTSKTLLKQLSFYCGCLFIFSSVIFFFIAKNKNASDKSATEAIIISPVSTITGSPAETGTKLFLLHEGTKVVIMEENALWTEIKIANGNTGWIKNACLEKI